MGAMTDAPAPPPPPPQNPYNAPQPMSPGDEKLWSTLAHVGPMLGSLASAGWLVSLIMYLVLKDRGPFVRQHTATALNFQLTLLIGYVVSFVLMFIVIGFLTFFAVWVVSI